MVKSLNVIQYKCHRVTDGKVPTGRLNCIKKLLPWDFPFGTQIYVHTSSPEPSGEPILMSLSKAIQVFVVTSVFILSRGRLLSYQCGLKDERTDFWAWLLQFPAQLITCKLSQFNKSHNLFASQFPVCKMGLPCLSHKRNKSICLYKCMNVNLYVITEYCIQLKRLPQDQKWTTAWIRLRVLMKRSQHTYAYVAMYVYVYAFCGFI